MEFFGANSMTLQELQDRVLQLSLSERWRLVESLLNSIRKEMQVPSLLESEQSYFMNLDPWTQSLVGVVQLNIEDEIDIYTNYLEEKYR
ncbi:hypothetical protein [Oscillatoria sp. FACHB-1406]|uniref:hypothetical protein n=1 Tax=Oscillatoria sp. FACHB-1406 TaxID=2692846 RepID=UPI001F554FAA|nr:hypothetical protein [Oscillatoria sp. FACHB-1406]